MNSNLTITNKTMTWGGTVWQLNNITRLFKFIEPKENELPNNPEKIKEMTKFLTYAIGVFVIGWIFSWTGLKAISVIIGAGLGYYIYKMKEENNATPKTYNKYYLKIETAAGSTDVFHSLDELFIDRLISKINDVMQHKDDTTNLTVNIDNSTVIDNISGSTVVTGSNISNSTVS